jgi:hypothetical protein
MIMDDGVFRSQQSERKGSLLCLQKADLRPRPEPDKFSPDSQTFFKYFIIIIIIHRRL